MRFQNPIASGSDVLGFGGSGSDQAADTTQQFDASGGAAADAFDEQRGGDVEAFDATGGGFEAFDEEENQFLF